MTEVLMARLDDIITAAITVGTPIDNQVAIWTGDGTLEGDADFTYDGTLLTLDGDFIFSNDNPNLLGGDTNGVLNISTNTATLGARLQFYGDTHASQANDVEFYSSSTVTLHYDLTGTVWDFQANDIITTGAMGVGATSPGAKLEVEDGETATVIQISNTAGPGNPVLAFALSGTRTFTMGIDDGDSNKFKIGEGSLTANTRFTILSTGEIGIGHITPAGQLHVDQSSVTGTIPTLYLDQADISEELIRFDAVAASGVTNPISSDVTESDAPAGYLRININGTDRWLRFYADTD